MGQFFLNGSAEPVFLHSPNWGYIIEVTPRKGGVWVLDLIYEFYMLNKEPCLDILRLNIL